MEKLASEWLCNLKDEGKERNWIASGTDFGIGTSDERKSSKTVKSKISIKINKDEKSKTE